MYRKGTNRLFNARERSYFTSFTCEHCVCDFFPRWLSKIDNFFTLRAAARSARASPVSERLPLAKRAIYLTGLARRCGAKPRDSGGRAYVKGRCFSVLNTCASPRDGRSVPIMGTCHRASAAALGRGTQKHAQCPTCGLLYHTSDCGGRYAACPDLDVPLMPAPVVRRREHLYRLDRLETFDEPYFTSYFTRRRTRTPDSKNSINRDPTHFEWILRYRTRKHH